MNALSSYTVRVPDDAHWRNQIKCQSACPVHTDARGYIRAIAEGDLEGAYLIARGPNPFASICGRICGAPCELNCRRAALDTPVSIRSLKRFACENHGNNETARELSMIEELKRAFRNAACAGEEELGALVSAFSEAGFEQATGKRVAIIGSGPGGLAAAHDLAIFGFQPVVFEMEAVPAGMLYLGVPEYRLPRELIEAEVAAIVSMGVEIRTKVEVGRDITVESLLAEYSAVVIAVGAKKCRALRVKGAGGAGVMGGVDFLRTMALHETVPMGEEIVVIGGGNVAYDVSRTALRQNGSNGDSRALLDREVADDVSRMALRQSGVKRVHLCCLESREDMLADEIEIREGTEEGVILHNSIGPDEILLDGDGNVRGVRFSKVLSIFDESGRFAPTFDENETVEIPADTVLVAIGQESDFSLVGSAQIGVEHTARGTLKVNSDQMTTRQGLFIAGDAAHGPKLMIDAIASGKRVARAVYEYVTGQAIAFEQTSLHIPLPGYARRPRFEVIPRQRPTTERPELRKASASLEVEHGFDSKQALWEAERCLDCGVNTVFDGTKCVLCGGCVEVCPEQCLKLVSFERLEGDSHIQRLKALWLEQCAGPASAIIKNDDRCTRCALCAERCPVGAITMERFTFGQLPNRRESRVTQARNYEPAV